MPLSKDIKERLKRLVIGYKNKNGNYVITPKEMSQIQKLICQAEHWERFNIEIYEKRILIEKGFKDEK